MIRNVCACPILKPKGRVEAKAVELAAVATTFSGGRRLRNKARMAILTPHTTPIQR
jgi:hypothetical protein